jgi:hypothetical protein
MSHTIDSILKLISLIGFLLVGSGLLKLMIYYKAFRIRIFPFLNLQEVLLSFTDNLIAYFFILMLTFVTGYIFNNNLETYGLTLETFKHMAFFERSLAYVSANYDLLILIMLLNIVTIVVWKFRQNIYGYEAILIILVLWICLFIVPILINELSFIQFGSQQPLGVNYLVLIMGAVALILFVMASAYSEIYKVKKSAYFEGSEFLIKGVEFKSTEKFFYVGQSMKYIFFYNSESDHSEVYPIDKVEKFKFVR